MAYTLIALQQLVLFNNYPSIYWNTATLTVNSGSIEDDEVEDGEETIKAKSKSTDYGKIASAIGDLQQRGVTIALPLINQANYSFTPDEKNNRIIFGLRGITGIGDDVANTIVNLRPYESFEDFFEKVTQIEEDDEVNVKIQNAKIISLIKAGCFDELESRSRVEVMMDYLKLVNPPKVRLNMQNWRTIKEYEMIPEKLHLQERIVNFKDYMLRPENFIKKDDVFKSKKIYRLAGASDIHTTISEDFFQQHFMSEMEEDKHYWYDENGKIEFYDSDLRRFTDKITSELRQWLLSDEALDLYNKAMYDELWEKDCQGSLSRWEMDSVSFYSHDHELQHVDFDYYDVEDFNELDEEPVVIDTYTSRGREWDVFSIHRIIGTVLDKNKTKNTVSLLTPTGVVTLKLYRGSFNHYDKQLSKPVMENGKEKNQVVESSWFKRGNLLSVVGFRRGSTFVPKKYRDSIVQHTIELITEVTADGDIFLQSERKKVD